MQPLDESEIQSVIEALRGGATVHVGGSRAHSTLGIGPDGWYWLHFDEGSEQAIPGSEADLRELAARDPDALVPVLRLPHWRRLSHALHAREFAAARAALQAWLRWGDELGRGALVDALLQAEQDREPQALEALQQALRGAELYWLYLATLGGDRGQATTERGGRFLAWIEALIGPAAEGMERLRARVEAHARSGP